SNKCFICAKAKRQRQMFYLCESEASATNVYCAKAKRQQQMFTVRKQSDSNKCLLCESEATATNVYCAKAKR
ncbi:hypothetical protein, partial [Lysinibacillus agricola]|uniref:hypothetical protein n=1 Tax=Lysinibacillus agricola TaxID=2590012 RepID=UPI003C278A2E